MLLQLGSAPRARNSGEHSSLLGIYVVLLQAFEWTKDWRGWWLALKGEVINEP